MIKFHRQRTIPVQSPDSGNHIRVAGVRLVAAERPDAVQAASPTLEPPLASCIILHKEYRHGSARDASDPRSALVTPIKALRMKLWDLARRGLAPDRSTLFYGASP
jgi:hypothetical protein